MAVLTSPPRTRPRFGPQAGLVAATRGVAFTGLMLAGLGLLIVIVGAVFFTALGVAALIVGNRGPQDSHMLLALVVLGTGLGLARFAVPYALLGVRGLARLTRQLAGDWCGVPIPERYTPRPDEALTVTERLTWLAMDPATWRDLWWTVASLVACILAALPAVIIAIGLIEFIGPELTREIPPPAFPGNAAGTLIVLGLAIASTGVLAAPALLRAYGLLARSMLTPDGEAELALRVRQLTADPHRGPRHRRGRDPPDRAGPARRGPGPAGRHGHDAGRRRAGHRHQPRSGPGAGARGQGRLGQGPGRAARPGPRHPPAGAGRPRPGRRDPRAGPGQPAARIHLASDLTGRPPAPVESAAYFAVSELLANVSKHAEARQTWIDIRHADEMLRIGVTDNGHGGADPSRGTGLRGIERRLAAFDGVLAISSPPGGPTAVTMEIPCALSSPKTSSC